MRRGHATGLSAQTKRRRLSQEQAVGNQATLLQPNPHPYVALGSSTMEWRGSQPSPRYGWMHPGTMVAGLVRERLTSCVDTFLHLVRLFLEADNVLKPSAIMADAIYGPEYVGLLAF